MIRVPKETPVPNEALVLNKRPPPLKKMGNQDFADEIMKGQFIAGLTLDAPRVKLIGIGHSRKPQKRK